jgi:hypothetical protein
VIESMNDREFLNYMEACGEDGVMVSAEQVRRLAVMARWPNPDVRDGWWGRIPGETIQTAVDAARGSLRSQS